MKGTYLLIMVLQNDTLITVGKLGTIDFKKGWYAYIGSAFNGLDQRLQRHLRQQKKVHWHIDYLLASSTIVSIFFKENTQKEECRIAQVFQRKFTSIAGFGCSDCYCPSHLFFGSSAEFTTIAHDLRMTPYHF